MKNNSNIAGADTKRRRPYYDFYKTPPGAVLALLSVETFDRDVWEPACGDGAISKVLIAQGFNVISSDIIDRGFGEVGKNFFAFTRARASMLITNPPFSTAEDFLKHAKHLGVRKIAFLLKLSFLEGKSRSHLLEQSGLSRVWVFRGRINVQRNGDYKGGSGMIAFAWFVWDDTHDGPPVIGWIDEIDQSDILQQSFLEARQ